VCNRPAQNHQATNRVPELTNRVPELTSRVPGPITIRVDQPTLANHANHANKQEMWR